MSSHPNLLGMACHGFDGAHSRYEAMLAFNKEFVDLKKYEAYAVKAVAAGRPRCVIVTCMDTRLTHLLPAALNIQPDDAKIIRTAGAILSHPFGSSMRSIIVALYELHASEVYIIGHTDCGMRHVDAHGTCRKIVQAGVSEDRLTTLKAAGIDVYEWLKGFESVDHSVLTAVNVVKRHPLVPPHLRVYGLVIDPVTGLVRPAASETNILLPQ